jgi:hypothetical protein
LEEETGLKLPVQAANLGEGNWAVFFAEMKQEAQVRLDEEHDDYQWVSLDEAAKRCRPEQVGAAVKGVGKKLGFYIS